MTITENDRLNLRKGFAKVFESERLAEIAMEAMPPLDYASIATKRDLDAIGAELRGEMAELRGDLRGEMAELRGDLRGEMADLKVGLSSLDAKIDSKAAEQMKIMVLTMLTTTVMLGGYVTAVLG